MRTMYDAVTPANIPADAEAVAGYIDGRYAWSQADWARFSTPVKVTIAVFAAHDARCLDVETGDATPDQAPGWVARQRANGDPHPWVYCSESVWSQVRQAFAAQGVPEPIWWIAAYPGSAGAGNLYPGAHAHQWIDDGPYDRSVLADHIPGIDPDPPPPPSSKKASKPMYVVNIADRQSWGVITSEGTKFHIATPVGLTAFTALSGQPAQQIEGADWDQIGWAPGANAQ